jgi:hypothetical protein
MLDHFRNFKSFRPVIIYDDPVSNIISLCKQIIASAEQV